MAASLREGLAARLTPQAAPGEGPFWSLDADGVAALAESRGWSLNQAMAACLAEDIWPERLRPNRGALTAAEQARLLGSRATVLGCGGLGGQVVLQLARLGVGQLVLCDGDTFAESNLNRQMLCNIERLGRNKALCAAEEVARISPAVAVEAHALMATPENLPGILAGAAVVLDCLDNMPARYQAEAAARVAGAPFVHGALAGLEGMVMVVRPDGPGLAALYGSIPAAKADSAETLLGVPTPTPAFIATLQVAEALKLLLGWPGLGPGQVLHADLGAPCLELLAVGC